MNTNIIHIKSVSLWWCLYVAIKQHLSNIWSSIHEKAKQHLGRVEKKRCLQKNLVASPCPCCPAIRECMLKKTHIEKRVRVCPYTLVSRRFWRWYPQENVWSFTSFIVKNANDCLLTKSSCNSVLRYWLMIFYWNVIVGIWYTIKV